MEQPTTELLYCGNDSCHDDEGDGDGDRKCHDRSPSYVNGVVMMMMTMAMIMMMI